MPVEPPFSPTGNNGGGRLQRPQTETVILRQMRTDIDTLKNVQTVPLQIPFTGVATVDVFHQLNRYPTSVLAWDGSGNQIAIASMQATDLNHLVVNFSGSESGTLAIF